MASVSEVIVHTDGASRGNPGPAAIGLVITDREGRVLLELGEALPRTTNNVAEYTAVIRGLERARALGAHRVHCLLDSQLVVRQLNGSYKVKHADMLPLYRRVLELVQQFEEVTFAHVPREMNAEADRLANAALDSRAPIGERLEVGGEAVVRQFADGVAARDWDAVRRLLDDGFQYRRPASGAGELDAEAFLGMARAQSLAWRVEQVAAVGAIVLVEARVRDRTGEAAGLLVCEQVSGRLRAIAEYRDRGE